MDPLEEVATRQIRARLWRKGELPKEVVHTRKLEDYSKELENDLRVKATKQQHSCYPLPISGSPSHYPGQQPRLGVRG